MGIDLFLKYIFKVSDFVSLKDYLLPDSSKRMFKIL